MGFVQQPYKTIRAPGTAELVIKKSRFIGRIAPVTSAEEAMAFVREIKKRHWDASHHVWAYALRDGQRRCSDDGEPQGTAGLPALEVLQKEELVDCAAVITRYFGGTKLGAAGLCRAYAGACKAAIEAAGVVTMAPTQTLRVACDYSFYGKLQTLVPLFEGLILSTDFGERVVLELRLEAGQAERFRAKLVDASNGIVKAEVIAEGFAALSS